MAHGLNFHTWQAAMSSDKSYVIRASGATNALSVSPNGNVALTVYLEVGSGASYVGPMLTMLGTKGM